MKGERGRMDVVREVLEVVGRVVRLVVRVIKVVVVVIEEVCELVRVGGRVGRVVWELVGEGRGVVVMIGGWMWRIGGWLKERVEDWWDDY